MMETNVMNEHIINATYQLELAVEQLIKRGCTILEASLGLGPPLITIERPASREGFRPGVQSTMTIGGIRRIRNLVEFEGCKVQWEETP